MKHLLAVGFVIILSGLLLAAFANASSGTPVSVTRVSENTAIGQGNRGSYDITITPDQHYAVFTTDATNLVPGDTNGVSDIIIKDLLADTYSRLSTSSSGAQANYGSYTGSISSDARYLTFVSKATNLVPGLNDNNGFGDVYLKDTQTGTVTLVSTNTGGTVLANGESSLATISSDGRNVAFLSQASNLVPGDTNGVMDVFVRDTVAGTTTRVSTDSSGAQGNGVSGYDYPPCISGNGRYVTFESDASNLVAGDTIGATDIFVKDLQTGVTTRVSTTSTGEQANDRSFFPSISKDGRYVLFRSQAYNLGAGDSPACQPLTCSDVFRKDTVTGAVTWISTDAAGNPANSGSWDPHLSADGRYAAFTSDASNLAAGDTNNNFDLFVKDADTGAIYLTSVNASGQVGNNWSVDPFVADGGGLVGFGSLASNLVAGDTNNVVDVFVSTFPTNNGPKPGLTVSMTTTRWANYADYLARLLTVDFTATNPNGPAAFNLSLVGEQTTNGVTEATTLPLNLGDLQVGGNVPFSLQYNVPDGVAYFRTIVFATANDASGLSYSYPAPYPGA